MKQKTLLVVACIALFHLQAFALDPAKFEWGGDLRYRINKAHEATDRDRTYQQLRARLSLGVQVEEDVKANLRLATGTSAISHDQVMGDAKDPGMPRRGFGIDQAYIDWKFGSAANLWAGRTANPFYQPGKSQLIFDSDLAFEGMAVKIYPHSETGTIFLNLAGYVISEEFAAPDDIVDVGLVGGDIGYKLAMDGWSWTSHIGNYYYLNIQDKQITAMDKGAAVDAYSYPIDSYRGNSVYTPDAVAPRKYYFENQYVLLEAGTEWKQTLGEIEYTLFVDWVKNSKVSKANTGLEFGFNVKWWRIWAGVAQSSKARDSVVGAFTDSDMIGGGTDLRGQRIQLGGQLSKNSTLVLTRFQGKRGVDTVERNFERTMLEANISF